MFKICSATPSDVKMHFVSTNEIVKEVRDNLESRYGLMLLDKNEGNECMWDPGGMMIADDEIFNFHLANITIMCRAQHFDFFVHHLQQYEPRGDSEYIKIHGHWFCICISSEEFKQLKKLVCNVELAVKAAVSASNREDKIDELVESGHVVRAVRGEDGKLYKAERASNNPDIPQKHLH